jgi:hypothetical protein
MREVMVKVGSSRGRCSTWRAQRPGVGLGVLGQPRSWATSFVLANRTEPSAREEGTVNAGAGTSRDEPTIAVSRLRKTYGGAVAIDDVSLSVAAGEIFGILGPNGAGKTVCWASIRRSIARSCTRSSGPSAKRARFRPRLKVGESGGGRYCRLPPDRLSGRDDDVVLDLLDTWA